ncbi:MAG: PPK2 family polyphosphate kinase [Flavobacteriales bacterium]
MTTTAYRITSGEHFKLNDFKTSPTTDADKSELKERIQSDIEEIKKVQELFFADRRYAVLMIFQAMDAAGKDGAIKHVMSGINPQGCNVHAFKAPNSTELAHDFLWRHHQVMPERGKIGIHNRSHYEFVLTCRVNPHYVLNENLPDVRQVGDLDKKFWDARLKQILHFEQKLVENGTLVLKFFLNVSKEEQKKRLLERIDVPAKHWKFDPSDLQSRAKWDEYMYAYQEAIRATSTKQTPWYIIPADDKWYARALIARILKETLQSLDIRYPAMSEADMQKLEEARKKLIGE